MNITDIQPSDVLVSVDARGAAYYRVIKVNRVTVDAISENGNEVRMRPHLFNRKVNYQVDFRDKLEPDDTCTRCEPGMRCEGFCKAKA